MKTAWAMATLLVMGLISASAPAETSRFDVRQSVVVVPVQEDVDVADVRESILSKAVELNMKLVGHQPLSDELRARGLDSGELQIFQFCNPQDARRIVDFDMTFAAYLPCRIVLVERDGRLFLTMIDLNFLIQNTALPPDLLDVARRVKSNLEAIMEAGATGNF